MSNSALRVLAGAGATEDPLYIDDAFSTSVYTAGGTTLESSDATASSFDDKTTAFTDNGNKTIGWDGSSEVRIHSLSTKFDLTTASSHSTTSSLSNTGGEYYMTQDGTKMYNNPGAGTVYQYSLSSAFDLSSASLVNSKSGFSTGGTTSWGLLMKDDGTKLITQFGGSSTTSRFEEWTLSTPYDITTASLQNTTAAQVDGGGVTTAISADGHYLYWLGSRADVLAQFFLPTAWSVAGAIYVGNVYYVPYTGSVGIGLAIGGDNSEILWAGNNTNGYYKFQTNFDVSYIHRLFGFSKQAVELDLLTDSPKFLIWAKSRSAVGNHHLIDSENGLGSYWRSNDSTNTAFDTGNTVGSLSTTGWGRIRAGLIDDGTTDYVSWTFKEAEGFFSIVTWTGNGVAGRTITHNLGSTPGMIIMKNVGRDGVNTSVYHKHLKEGYPSISITSEELALYLNTEDYATAATYMNNTAPTSTVFSVGSGLGSNYLNDSYVAYVFADDSQTYGEDSDESVIKCGYYVGNGSTTGPIIDLGFEPQWVMIKKVEGGGSNYGWIMADMMRGMNVAGQDDPYLWANDTDAEYTTYDWITALSTGFQLTNTGGSLNANNYRYIYVAIRRPQKPASEFAATKLFNVDAGANTTPGFETGFPVDMGIFRSYQYSGDFDIMSRLTGLQRTDTPSAGAEANKGTRAQMDHNDGWSTSAGSDIGWAWRRAPGYFDVVCYTGTGSNAQVSHNLGEAPEMIWVKDRSSANNWAVYHSGTHPTVPEFYSMILNSTNTRDQSATYWNDTKPTNSVFTVSSNVAVNTSGDNYIAYLFATVAGISKVGSYSGTGSDINVDCGFSAGARFILIKRADNSGDWYLYDSVQGIVAGNDPYLLLSSTAAQVTNTDYIDPLNAGFTVTSSAPAALNASGGTYIFYAIA